MKATVIPRCGGPEVFERRVVDRPASGPGEVLVRVQMSGANPVDAKLRADASWAGLDPPLALGYDVSRVVEEVGPGVADLTPGDEVYYTPEIFGNTLGSYAEFNPSPASIIAPKPKGISHEEGAANRLAGEPPGKPLCGGCSFAPGETVRIAAAPQTRGHGVVIAMGGRIDAARDATKVHARALRASGSFEHGALGGARGACLPKAHPPGRSSR